MPSLISDLGVAQFGLRVLPGSNGGLNLTPSTRTDSDKMSGEAQPFSMRSIDAIVPARPKPPLQCTMMLIPDKCLAAKVALGDRHGEGSRATGTAPSVTGRPSYVKPCTLARSTEEVICSSSNSRGSINVI